MCRKRWKLKERGGRSLSYSSISKIGVYASNDFYNLKERG
jgi:hypothetical protein